MTQTDHQFGMLPTFVLRILWSNNTGVVACRRGPTLEKTFRRTPAMIARGHGYGSVCCSAHMSARYAMDLNVILHT